MSGPERVSISGDGARVGPSANPPKRFGGGAPDERHRRRTAAEPEGYRVTVKATPAKGPPKALATT
jgi:hypothetical protein